MVLTDFRAVYMPYVLRKQENGLYVVLNRMYKPVGFATLDWVNYEDYPIASKIKGIGPKTAKKLSCENSENTDIIYLYDDSCTPTRSAKNMQVYFKKLAILAKLQILI